MEITKNTDKLCLKNIQVIYQVCHFMYQPTREVIGVSGAGKKALSCDDIWDFTLNKSTTFYCLQPIVVTRGTTVGQLMVNNVNNYIFNTEISCEHDHLRRPLEEAYRILCISQIMKQDLNALIIYYPCLKNNHLKIQIISIYLEHIRL